MDHGHSQTVFGLGLLEHGCRQVQPLQKSSRSPVPQLLAQETSASKLEDVVVAQTTYWDGDIRDRVT